MAGSELHRPVPQRRDGHLAAASPSMGRKYAFMERPRRDRAARSCERILYSLSLDFHVLINSLGCRPYPDIHCLGAKHGTQSYPLDGDDGI